MWEAGDYLPECHPKTLQISIALLILIKTSKCMSVEIFITAPLIVCENSVFYAYFLYKNTKAN